MSKKNKIFFDIETGGLKQGELSFIMGPPSNGNKSNLIREVEQRLIEQAKKEGYVLIGYEMPPMTKTTYEKIGDTIFPVNHHSNGMVTVDYPDSLFCQQIKKNKREE